MGQQIPLYPPLKKGEKELQRYDISLFPINHEPETAKHKEVSMSKEIPREEWIRFFDDFSKQHEGWIVNWEVLGRDIGDQEKTYRLPARRHQCRQR